jgi:hypothetical protein
MANNTVDLLSIQGLEIVPDRHVSDYELTKRSWAQRWFTTPWQPWRKYESQYKPAMYIVSNGSVLVSYQTKELIMRALLERADAVPETGHNPSKG